MSSSSDCELSVRDLARDSEKVISRPVIVDHTEERRLIPNIMQHNANVLWGLEACTEPKSPERPAAAVLHRVVLSKDMVEGVLLVDSANQVQPLTIRFVFLPWFSSRLIPPQYSDNIQP